MIRQPIMLALMLPAAASAQPAFLNVASECGVLHTNPYGQTFDFSGEQHPQLGPIEMQVMQRNMGNGAAAADYDDDGDLDLYLLGQWTRGNVLYRNELDKGLRLFTDATEEANLTDTGFSRLAHFADLDNDGRLDLILFNDTDPSGLYPPSRILRNTGGKFLDLTPGSGFAPIGHLVGGACLGDYDADGLLDVYVTFWTFHLDTGPSAFPGRNVLYRNLGGFRFEDATESAGLGSLARDSFACVFADFDNDGDADLYVAVDHTSDAYYRNDGGTFADDTLAAGATHTGNDMGLAVADFDNDGDLDVYSTNITDPSRIFGTTQYNILLVNQLAETGTMSFVDQALARGVADTYWGWGTEWTDVDNDGRLDLFAVNGFDQFIQAVGGTTHPLANTPSVLFMSDGNGGFTTTSETGADHPSDARGLISLDYDRDGDRDFLITNVNQPAALLENLALPRPPGSGQVAARTEPRASARANDPTETDPVQAGTRPDPHHWLDIHLAAACNVNADAIGSRVYATVGKTTYMQELIAGGSYLAGRPFELHFGLADAATVDQLRVVWPDGDETILHDVPADRRITVTQSATATAHVAGRTDLRTFAAFQTCFGAPRLTATGRLCGRFDTDWDGRISAADFADFIAAFDLGACPPGN